MISPNIFFFNPLIFYQAIVFFDLVYPLNTKSNQYIWEYSLTVIPAEV